MATPFPVNAVSNELSNYPKFWRFLAISTAPVPPSADVQKGLGRAALPEVVNFPSLTRLLTVGTNTQSALRIAIAEIQGKMPTLAILLTRILPTLPP
jgi:hypothetical protein